MFPFKVLLTSKNLLHWVPQSRSAIESFEHHQFLVASLRLEGCDGEQGLGHRGVAGHPAVDGVVLRVKRRRDSM